MKLVHILSMHLDRAIAEKVAHDPDQPVEVASTAAAVYRAIDEQKVTGFPTGGYQEFIFIDGINGDEYGCTVSSNDDRTDDELMWHIRDECFGENREVNHIAVSIWKTNHLVVLYLDRE